VSDINYDNYETVEDYRWFFDNNYGPHANKMAQHIIGKLEQATRQRDDLLSALVDLIGAIDETPDNEGITIGAYIDERLYKICRAAIAAAHNEATP